MDPPDYYYQTKKRTTPPPPSAASSAAYAPRQQEQASWHQPAPTTSAHSHASPWPQPPPASYNPYAKMESSAGYNDAYEMPGAPSHRHPQQAYPPNAYQQPGPDAYYGGGGGQTLMSEPMVNMARAYGEQLAEQQKEKLSRFVSVARLKYYFAVDNAYVGKKIALLLFPFAHRDWSVKQGSEPVAPRYDLNAADLYIPSMAILTYIFVAAFVLGMQGRFSPEQLGLLTSNALAWLVCENALVAVTKFVMNISHALSFWHSLAYSSYKFVGMILSVMVCALAGSTAYYCTLGYTAVAIAFYLVGSARGFILEAAAGSYGGGATKRKLYLIAYIALSQPLIMWWLTSAVTAGLPPRGVFAPPSPAAAAAAAFAKPDFEIPADMLGT